MAKVSDRAVLVYQIERRSRSDCVHEQVAKRIANVRFTSWEVRTNQGGLPSSEGQPSRRKKGGLPMYVTYSDLIQIGIFIVALIG